MVSFDDMSGLATIQASEQASISLLQSDHVQCLETLDKDVIYMICRKLEVADVSRFSRTSSLFCLKCPSVLTLIKSMRLLET